MLQWRYVRFEPRNENTAAENDVDDLDGLDSWMLTRFLNGKKFNKNKQRYLKNVAFLGNSDSP